jgi:hypothetical protein
MTTGGVVIPLVNKEPLGRSDLRLFAVLLDIVYDAGYDTSDNAQPEEPEVP